MQLTVYRKSSKNTSPTSIKPLMDLSLLRLALDRGRHDAHIYYAVNNTELWAAYAPIAIASFYRRTISKVNLVDLVTPGDIAFPEPPVDWNVTHKVEFVGANTNELSIAQG